MKKILQLLFSVCLFGFGAAQVLKPIAQKVADQKTAKRNFAKFSPFAKDVASKNAAVYNNEASDVTVMQLKTAELQRIVSEKPQAMELSFPFEGGDVTVELIKNDIFAGGFKVGTDKGDANYTPGVYYQGIIKGDNTSVVAFSFFDNDIVGVASTNELGNIVVGKAKSSQDFVSYSDYKLKSKNPFSCSADELPENKINKPSFDPNAKKASKDANSCIRIYFEVGYGPYTQNGSNVTSTSNWVTALFNNIKTLYDNESVKVAISEIYVWTSTDPYSGQPSTILNQFRTTRTTFNGDVAQLIRNPATTSVAYVNSICSVYKYSYCGVNAQNIAVPTYSWNIEAMTHELGHNFGSPHTHACAWNGNNTAIDGCGPASGNDEGCDGPLPTTTKGTIMSYCHLVGSVGISFANGFGQQPGDLIRQTIAGKPCLGSDCINSCDVTVTGVTLSALTGNSVTATIADATGTTWKYRLSKTTDDTVVQSGSTSNKVLNFNGLDPNSFYKIEIGTECSATYQQAQVFITDGSWCGKIITDTGGENGNYSNNENWTKTFYPDAPGQKLKINFTEFNLGAHYITLRNGLANSPVFTGAARLSGSTIPNSYESTHESGAITLTFRSDDSFVGSGFKANFSCTVLAVDDVVNSKDVALYPNPVKNQFTLKGITKMKSVEVYDISGKLVKQFDTDSLSKNTFDVSRLKTGNYVVQVKTENDSFSKKLIKQ
ncbi:T9SS type A sorting domain-containing protein [Epilithonimonas hungarica]|uniref:Por secretion system C-terminal sorting domain-containing protein n=1 Tax=Epilithonimonas hungarica TaxID=454006 RepID=A0A1G7HJD8_9FLAO|nr:T9SS type A sorting domain-containing protein [Epilithonimonas hungarica]SDF00545.1 Por secretion system C-terminal sorting domain-containing protein [Epilithonimonas hungarica]